MDLYIPAYVSTSQLSTYYNLSPAPRVMIVNNGNGPGSSKNTSLDSAMSTIQGKGIKVIGYVNTGHMSVGISTAESQVDSWYSFYGSHIDGIYFDNVDGHSGTYDSTTYNYYELAGDHVRNKTNGSGVNHVCFGCGAKFMREFLQVCDTISVWEYGYNGNSSNYPSHSNLSPWVYDTATYGYSSDRFIGWMYSGTNNPGTSGERAFVDACYNNNIGSVFVIDHPSYSTLIGSTLLSDEVSYVASK